MTSCATCAVVSDAPPLRDPLAAGQAVPRRMEDTVTMRVTTGAEAIVRDPKRLHGAKIGLLTNFTGVLPDLSRNIDGFISAGVPLAALYGPEHGLDGAAQAGRHVAGGRDERTDLPVAETYLATDEQLDAMLLEPGIDNLVFDMQDVGVRFYTYIWSMFDAMRSAARVGIRFTVLDRPNPLGGAVASGPPLSGPEFASFVGRADIPVRHGLTVGELARLFAQRELAIEGLDLDLDIVRVEGWDATRDLRATGLTWVPPSPNMPLLDTAYAFCGMGLVEGTTLSEGRGTTRPFETVGAPFLSGQFAQELRSTRLPGVIFRDVVFEPTFHKYAGQTCRGVQLHLTDLQSFDPIATALAVLRAAVLDAPAESSSLAAGERLDPGHSGYALDRLWGGAELRAALAGEVPFSALIPRHTPVVELYGDDVLLYPRAGSS